jgi:hypothetical protein
MACIKLIFNLQHSYFITNYVLNELQIKKNNGNYFSIQSFRVTFASLTYNHECIPPITAQSGLLTPINLMY